jgi:hypothetical protein
MFVGTKKSRSTCLLIRPFQRLVRVEIAPDFKESDLRFQGSAVLDMQRSRQGVFGTFLAACVWSSPALDNPEKLGLSFSKYLEAVVLYHYVSGIPVNVRTYLFCHRVCPPRPQDS